MYERYRCGWQMPQGGSRRCVAVRCAPIRGSASAAQAEQKGRGVADPLRASRAYRGGWWARLGGLALPTSAVPEARIVRSVGCDAGPVGSSRMCGWRRVGVGVAVAVFSGTVASWKRGRAAEGTCLENRSRETCRGFESYRFRHPVSAARSSGQEGVKEAQAPSRRVIWGSSMVERPTLDRKVEGSSPSPRTQQGKM